MKKTTIVTVLAAVAVLCSCGKDNGTGSEVKKADGVLSFENCGLEVDDAVEPTKAVTPAKDNYTIIVKDKAGVLADVTTTYSEIKAAGQKMSLPEGNYTVIARSSAGEVPYAAFEEPVYGIERDVAITSGEVTALTDMVCRLLQTKVTVAYSDELLAMIDGECTTTVSVNPSYPLEYKVHYAGATATYDQAAGYFAVNNGSSTTMDITFKGHVEGGLKTMTQALANIKPCTWHQIKFIKKVNPEGTADIDVVITDYVSDEELGNDFIAQEDIIGEDPDAPKGDGGIKLESTCSYDITQPIPVPKEGETFILTMKATVPNMVSRFNVEITSDNPAFITSVQSINDGSSVLDLVNPSSGAIQVFTEILPFPYGEAVAGKQEIAFDLSAAQIPILTFQGTHTFTMNVQDKMGCKKSIMVQMVVE